MYFICDKITFQQLQYGCTIMSRTANLMLNPYCIEFVSGNLLIYLRFLLFMKTGAAQIVEIRLREDRARLSCISNGMVADDLAPCVARESTPLLWPSFVSKYSGFSTSRVKMTLDVCIHCRYDDMPLTNISAGSYYLHDKIISHEFTGQYLCHQENIL